MSGGGWYCCVCSDSGALKKLLNLEDRPAGPGAADDFSWKVCCCGVGVSKNVLCCGFGAVLVFQTLKKLSTGLASGGVGSANFC